jgi:hypothetical protein
MSTDTMFGPAVNGRLVHLALRRRPAVHAALPQLRGVDAGSEYSIARRLIWRALNGVAYLDEGGFIYKHNGTSWDFWEAFGEPITPVAFADRLLVADLGHLFAFDGKKRSDLDFRFFESKGRYQGSKEPLALFQVTEGRLLTVNHDGDVMMTTDLETWSCIGKAPDDATSIGSLDGVVSSLT